MTFEIELGPDTRAAIGELASALKALSASAAMASGGGIGRPAGEWLRMSEAKRAWGISAPTIRKRAKEGLIEVRWFGEKMPRYRLADGATRGKEAAWA